MGENFTCGNNCVKYALNASEWCHDWRPPPIPLHLRDQLRSLVRNDEGFLLYQDLCGGYTPKPSTTKTITTTAAPFQQEEGASSAGGTIALIVSLVIVSLVVLAVVLLWYLWKYKKVRTASINSLPLKKYENTNFLDNKARQNRCYNGPENFPQAEQNSVPSTERNPYGSFPQSEGKANVSYVNSRNQNSGGRNVESPVEFDKMNTSVNSSSSRHSLSLGRIAYDNDTFLNDLEIKAAQGSEANDPEFIDEFEQSGARSPGVNSHDSQTPLFDYMDGSALPNSVPNSKALSENSVNSSDKSQLNGSLKKLPSGGLPPIDMNVVKSDNQNNSDPKDTKINFRRKKSSDSSLRSPKKKKAIYLQRKSSPVEGMEDLKQDMAGNRKSV